MTDANYIGMGMIAAFFLAIVLEMVRDIGAHAAIRVCAFCLAIAVLLGGGLYLVLSPP